MNTEKQTIRRSEAHARREHEVNKQIILARSTLALRYARRGQISQPMVDAMGELLTAYSHEIW